jgi:hypothetical protein
MTVSINKREISHLLVRLVAIVNLTHLTVAALYPGYYQILRRLQLDDILSVWEFASTFILPLYVSLEACWMWKINSEHKELLIDAVLALAWFFVWWGAILYTFTHRTIL